MDEKELREKFVTNRNFYYLTLAYGNNSSSYFFDKRLQSRAVFLSNIYFIKE